MSRRSSFTVAHILSLSLALFVGPAACGPAATLLDGAPAGDGAPADQAQAQDQAVPGDALDAQAAADSAVDAALDGSPDARADAATPKDAGSDQGRMDDAAPPDLASADATTPDDAASVDGGADADPNLLSSQGLYSDIATRTLAPGVTEYDPLYHLWSDGAAKVRWIKLPPGQVIDTSDMDHWRFPVGTRLYKQFSRDGVLIETRVITRTGANPEDVRLQSFVWRPDASDAVYTPDGAMNVNGTQADVPPEEQCGFCHAGQPSYILGFSALQLSKSGPGVTLDSLRQAGLLSDPPPAGTPYVIPGSDVDRAAIGYLHANCGHCHYPNGFPETNYGVTMHLFVPTAATAGAVSALPTWQTTVDQPLTEFEQPGGPYFYRVVSGDPSKSAIYHRMSSRGNDDQMPPYATELTDPTGLAAISAWITSLPTP